MDDPLTIYLILCAVVIMAWLVIYIVLPTRYNVFRNRRERRKTVPEYTCKTSYNSGIDPVLYQAPAHFLQPKPGIFLDSRIVGGVKADGHEVKDPKVRIKGYREETTVHRRPLKGAAMTLLGGAVGGRRGAMLGAFAGSPRVETNQVPVYEPVERSYFRVFVYDWQGWPLVDYTSDMKHEYEALVDFYQRIVKDNETMEQKFFQSCGMPLSSEVMGTEADGSPSEDYCKYCYADGHFLQDCTMDEMIEHCAQFVDEVNKHMPEPLTKEKYKQMMRSYFPMLKRWKK